jgi:uncharacterized protein YeaC (DUF1315 family)
MQAKVDRVRGINLRITRKRPLSALTWTLAPGLKIGVQVGSWFACLLVRHKARSLCISAYLAWQATGYASFQHLMISLKRAADT